MAGSQLRAVGAAWHATRGEVQSIVGKLVVAALLVLTVHVGTRRHRIEAR